MKTLIIKGKEYAGVQPKGMSDAAFKSMLLRNNMTTKAIESLRAGLERGKVK